MSIVMSGRPLRSPHKAHRFGPLPGALEIRFLRSRDIRVLIVIIFMAVFGADSFQPLAGAAPVGNGRSPGHREGALVLNREVDLQILAPIETEELPLRSVLAVLLCFFLAGYATAEPAAHWQNADPTDAWADAVSREVQAHGRSQRPTAVMIVQGDRVIAGWGDIERRVNVHSVRKSLLSALYGTAISEGRISLSSTLAQLGIDDRPPSLTDAEKQATVRDLLMARSGIYHPAAYETSDIRQKRPARGSHAAGTFWFYNNWDFNALGTIYRLATEEDIFQSFARRVAKPIDMEDFSARDGQYVLEASSIHPAYPFAMSARDLARFGLLFLNGGRWNAAQVIPAAWVRESTTAYSQTDRAARYGYLWWVLSSEEWGPGAFMAPGYGGQVVAVVPSKRLVAVETVDLRQNAQGARTRSFLDLVRKIAAAAL
jgi:CubicO group peptidase (beta-lactamase class C family)